MDLQFDFLGNPIGGMITTCKLNNEKLFINYLLIYQNN